MAGHVTLLRLSLGFGSPSFSTRYSARRRVAESLVRALLVVAGHSRLDGGADLVGGVPVAQPDVLLLERPDHAFEDGVSGRPLNGGEGVEEVPLADKLAAVLASLLGGITGRMAALIGPRAGER